MNRYTQGKHLNRAPIREALFGLVVAPLPATTSLPLIKAAAEKLESRYDVRTIAQNEAYLRLGADTQTLQQSRQVVGFRLERKDRLYALQARLDGFYFSRLYPYTHWVDVITEAKTVYSQFANVFSSAVLQMVLVRFINELTVPPNASLDKYLRFYTQIPDELPKSILHFNTRHVLLAEPDRVISIETGRLGQASNSSQDERILLDIEIRKTHLDHRTAWEAIDSQRDLKNSVFFHCITPDMEARLQ